MNRLYQLKEEYEKIEIPQELNGVVQKALYPKRKRNKVFLGTFLVAAAILIICVNTNATMAVAFADVPVVGNIVKLITFREFNINEKTYEANIKVPAVKDLGNKQLEDMLNQKYLAENEELYKDFISDMNEMKKNGDGHLGIESGYEVKTDNKQILSIGRYTVNTVGSSSTQMKYDTIDKQNKVLITLPSLFKNDHYISTISENIQEQMRAQMKADSNKTYWVKGINDDTVPFEKFEKIAKNQSFYISNEGKLVISFNKYDVAPGYMGIVEFVIPTKVIQKELVSNEYIK